MRNEANDSRTRSRVLPARRRRKNTVTGPRAVESSYLIIEGEKRENHF